MWRPPSTWACTWKTVWPASAPVLNTSRRRVRCPRRRPGPPCRPAGRRRAGWIRGELADVGVVRLGDHQDVRRRLRVEVAEGQRAVVLADHLGGISPATIQQNRQSLGSPTLEPTSAMRGASASTRPIVAASRALRTQAHAGVRDSSAAAAAVPAVEVRSTVGPSRTGRRAGGDEGGQLVVGHAALGPDHSAMCPPAGRSDAGERSAAPRAAPAPGGVGEQAADLAGAHRRGDLGQPGRRDCLPASRAVARHCEALVGPRPRATA